MSRHMPAQSEAAFQTAVIQLARFCGWHVWAPPPNRPGKTGRVPRIIGVVGGWPDLALWRGPAVDPLWPELPAMGRHEFMLAELKAEKGRLRDDQKETIDQLRACGLEVVVWRPSDWAAIEERLRRR